MKEKFKILPGLGGYQIGNLATIKGCEGSLRPSKRKDGYLQVCLHINGKSKTFLLHRLVALAHVPNPENLPEVNHGDGEKMNCAAWNLAWTDRSGNMKHAFDTGLKVSVKGAKHGRARLTLEQVEEIKSYRGIKKQSELSKIYNVGQGQISAIQLGKYW